VTKKHEEPTVSRHIEVFESDWRKLDRYFGRGAEGARLGISTAIRMMIRKAIRDYEERMVKKLDKLDGVSGGFTTLDRIFEEEAKRKEHSHASE